MTAGNCAAAAWLLCVQRQYCKGVLQCKVTLYVSPQRETMLHNCALQWEVRFKLVACVHTWMSGKGMLRLEMLL